MNLQSHMHQIPENNPQTHRGNEEIFIIVVGADMDVREMASGAWIPRTIITTADAKTR